MDYYNKIVDALARLVGWSKYKYFYSVGVSFKIEILDEYRSKDDILIPHLRVHAITNESQELIDLRLSLELFFDGEDETKSKQKYDEIMDSQLGFLFGKGPASQYNLSASLGKDVKMASALILYCIRLFSKSKEIEIKPWYYCPMVLDGEISNLQRKDEILHSQAIKNLMERVFDRKKPIGDTLFFNVLRDNRDDREFLAEVAINKRHEDAAYTAWIRSGEINVRFLDAMFKRFVEYPNKHCAKEFTIQDNALEVRVDFCKDQVDDLIYFIYDCLRVSYPDLSEDEIIAQVKYNYFSSVVQFYLTFYPDGKRPSDKELEYAFQLRDNLEYDQWEDECFEP